MRHEKVGVGEESVRLYKLLKLGLIIEVPLVVLTVASAIIAGSAALIALAAQSGVALVINGFALYAMRQVLRENVYTHPYGAGKLENFSAFLCGVLYIPSGLFVLYDSIERLIDAPEVGYLTGLIPVVATFVTGTLLFTMAHRLGKRTVEPSPLLVAYKADYFIGMCTDGGVLVAFVLGSLLVSWGEPAIGDRIDPIIALVMAVYMLYIGQELVRHNFRALMDLPLAENEQLAITKVLAHHYRDYDEVGIVFTRQSGNRRYVEIELGFDGEKTVEHVHKLSSHMEQDLSAELPGLFFHIVPVWEHEVEEEEAAAALTGGLAVEPT